ncbi:preprotein translocase subunit SecE [Solitalea canadensis]|uniref:Protein translocase subunit SecE n=1 Tax=Solitalea canadensis (strain ATCC 29591 / DSM 3403 / JCM 21819 / LMG 8368 / NBRC 15130 / NCIMB 12057 / USAM 9D) TaxID=929556 RepID=H8KP30_SOLCM|nr:preprotein translocase subunit SecE [Solitalea canadensis]AFD05552.1 preprotein translocase, SecE subunit [Solitalea canadensis DSM 3403]
MSKVVEYIKESKNELLNHVTWPTASELFNSAMVVIVASGIMAGIVFAMDEVFGHVLIESFYNLFS